MITFTYDGIDFSDKLMVHDIRGRSIAPSEVDTSDTPGRPGARFRRKRHLTRIIEIDVTVVSSSLETLREDVDELTYLLDKDIPRPLVFSDESDKTYYAILTGEAIEDAVKTMEQFTITFLCPDPMKYGPEKTADITNGEIITIGGRAPAKPITTVTLDAPSSFVAISNGDDINLIGDYPTAEIPEYQRNVRQFHDTMGTTTGWAGTTTSEDGPIVGTIGSQGGAFVPTDFGKGSTWHGPGLKKTLATPVQDFRVEVDLRNDTTTPKNTGSVHLALLDAAGQIVGKIVVIKAGLGNHRVRVHVKAGTKTNGKVVYNGYGPPGFEYHYFNGKIVVERVGNKWYMNGTRYSVARGWHAGISGQTVDTKLEAANPIAQVQVNFWQYNTRPTTRMEVQDIKFYRIDENPEAVPYIAEAGDQITFDHVEGNVYKNGININHESAFISRNFKLNPGQHAIVAEPEEAISNINVRWRDTWR